ARVVPCGLGVTVGTRAAGCFSESARPRPRGDEARRHRRRPLAPAVRGGRGADDLLERAAERAEAVEPHVEAGVGDAALLLPEQVHRPLDPPALQVAVRALAVDLLEGPDEVRRRHADQGGQPLDVELLAVAPVHLVARPEHEAVPGLDGAEPRRHDSPPAATSRASAGASVPAGHTTTWESPSHAAIRRSSRASAAATSVRRRGRASGAGDSSAQADRTRSSPALRSALRSTRATIWSPRR